MMKRYPTRILWFLFFFVLSATSVVEAQAPPVDPARELQLLLRNPAAKSRVLYVTAHPDDEDAGLLAWMRYHEGVETALMTLTRGEGGQNEIGRELQATLGVLRSRELEAAGLYTGTRQYFSSAYDFGYSFSVDETYDFWDKDTVTQELVSVIRELKPTIVLTLPHQGSGGGQHHQASAQLALEACTLAADPDYHEALKPVHQVGRLFQVVWDASLSPLNICHIDLSGYDEVFGGSYAEIGAWSRGQHKCQGMARLYEPHAKRISSWEFLWSSDPAADPPRPVETFWDGMKLPPLPWENFRFTTESLVPQSILRLLMTLWEAIPEGENDIHVNIARRRAARAIELATGIDLTVRTDRALLRPGQTFDVTFAARSPEGAASIDVTLEGSLLGSTPPKAHLTEAGGFQATVQATVASRPPPDSPQSGTPTHWYTLMAHPTLTLAEIRVPLAPRPVLIQELNADFPGIHWSPPAVVPDPSLRFSESTAPFLSLNGGPPDAELVVLVSTLSPQMVEVRVQGPAGLTITPPSVSLQTRGEGIEVDIHFRVSGVLEKDATLKAVGTLSGESTLSSSGYRRIVYPHITPSVFLEPAQIVLKPIEVSLQNSRVGFVEGTGDRIVESLKRLGLDPVLLDADALREDLSSFHTIITGVRAYKVREDLKAAGPKLLKWMQEGGNLVVMYNKYEFNDDHDVSPFAPYGGCKVSSDRITDEDARVTYLIPDHPLLNVPNALETADWSGWIQERGLYFLQTDNPLYQKLLSMEDPFPFNPGKKVGSLVWAPVGEGSWTYVGLGLFRQLPQAVPGAYRLLANLISQGTK